MEWLGIRWVGVNAENGHKLVLTVLFVAAVYSVVWLFRRVLHSTGAIDERERVRFWTRQVIALIAAIVTVLGVLSIWFDNPERLTAAGGFATAGVAFALQKVITSLAGYIVILRGRTFTVGDRIVMGGCPISMIVVCMKPSAITSPRTPPTVQSADPAMWVRSRQFTGRIVTVANSRIFDEPVYNYTRDFPFIWEEMTLPIGYKSDRARAERILLDAAKNHVASFESLEEGAREHLRQRYYLDVNDFTPRVFWRLTDNWIEMTVRFITAAHGVREVKDAMSREVIAALDAAGIGIASGTYEIVGLPPVRVESLPVARG